MFFLSHFFIFLSPIFIFFVPYFLYPNFLYPNIFYFTHFYCMFQIFISRIVFMSHIFILCHVFLFYVTPFYFMSRIFILCHAFLFYVTRFSLWPILCVCPAFCTIRPVLFFCHYQCINIPIYCVLHGFSSVLQNTILIHPDGSYHLDQKQNK